MSKFTLILFGLTALFAACHKEDSVEVSQCYTCVVKYSYGGTGGVYVPPPNTTTFTLCGTAEKDTLLKRNGMTSYGPGGFTSTVTQTASCTAIQ